MSRCGGPPDMWGKMTRLALAVAGGEGGGRGLDLSGVDRAAEATPPFRRFESPMEPIPSAPVWLRKWRRVVWRARWMDSGWIMGFTSPFGEGLVEVQDHVGDHRPGCQIAHVGVFGRGPQRLGRHRLGLR